MELKPEFLDLDREKHLKSRKEKEEKCLKK